MTLITSEPILESWLANSLAIPEQAFVPLGSFAPSLHRIVAESKASLDHAVRAEVHPQRGATGATLRVHAADPGGVDLLRYDYAVGDLQLLVLEAANFIIVEAWSEPADRAWKPTTLAYLRGLVDLVVAVRTESHDWHFDLPGDLDPPVDGRVLSNTGALPIRQLANRHERADIVIARGRVHFVFYKKIDQLMGFRPDDRWFPPAVRAAMAAASPSPE